LIIVLPATGGSCRTTTELLACHGADRSAPDEGLTGKICRQKNLSEALGYYVDKHHLIESIILKQ
jgi:hypothetical protein